MSTTHTTSVRNSTEERALQLLGSGLGPEIVASAVGVTASRISQLLSDPEFAAEVATLRFQSLQSHNERDNKYDTLEDALLAQLKNCLPLMHKPLEIVRAIGVINSAKRRGASAPEQITHQNTVLNLVIPIALIQKFTTNINNQVIHAGEQTLETIQSGTLLDSAKKKGSQNESINSPRIGTGNSTEVTAN
jgi:hypothetical protein